MKNKVSHIFGFQVRGGKATTYCWGQAENFVTRDGEGSLASHCLKEKGPAKVRMEMQGRSWPPELLELPSEKPRLVVGS